MRRPYDLPWLARPGRQRAVAFVAGLAASTAALAWMLSVPHEPSDVLRIQVAAPTRAIAADVLAGWRPFELADDVHRRDYAYLATFWLPLMAAAGWAAGRYAARGCPERARRGATVAWLPVFASLLDAAEDTLILRQIAYVAEHGAAAYAAEGPPYLAPLTTVAAYAKWVLVLLVLAYVAGALRGRRGQALTTAS